MVTLDALAEQVQRLYSSTNAGENIEPITDRRELYPLIVQLVNAELGTIRMDDRTLGEIHIPACLMVTYAAQPIQDDNGKKYVDIPVTPIRLPREMGVWDIKPNGSGWQASYIPVQPSMMKLLGDLEEASLEGQEGYWIEGSRAYFRNDALTGSVDIQLLVYDYQTANGSDIIPVYANMQTQIVAKAVELLKGGGLRPDWQKGKELPDTITPSQVEDAKKETE